MDFCCVRPKVPNNLKATHSGKSDIEAMIPAVLQRGLKQKQVAALQRHQRWQDVFHKKKEKNWIGRAGIGGMDGTFKTRDNGTSKYRRLSSRRLYRMYRRISGLLTLVINANFTSIKKTKQPKRDLVLVADLDIIGDDIGIFEMPDLPPLLGLTANFKRIFADGKIAILSIRHR